MCVAVRHRPIRVVLCAYGGAVIANAALGALAGERRHGPLNQALTWIRAHFDLPERFAHPAEVRHTSYQVGTTTVGEFYFVPLPRWRRWLKRM